MPSVDVQSHSHERSHASEHLHEHGPHVYVHAAQGGPPRTWRTMLKGDTWGNGVRLVILDSPYRLLVEPLVQQIYARRQPNETITIVVPQFVSAHRWQNFLHTNTAAVLREALLNQPGIVVTDVPYQLEEDET